MIHNQAADEQEQIREDFEARITDKALDLFSLQAGAAYNKDKQPRMPRSFSGERERQLLKQFSTRLFFHAKITPSERFLQLEEVETMHAYINGTSYLFITANQSYASRHLSKIVSDYAALKSALTANLTHKILDDKNNYEAITRAQRYANTFKNLAKEFDEDEVVHEEELDLIYFSSIKKLLIMPTTEIKKISLKYENPLIPGENESYKFNLSASSIQKIHQEIQEGSNGKIIFLYIPVPSWATPNTVNPLKTRHAEEYLIDVAEIINDKIPNDNPLHFCVGGKKRPCGSCYGRLDLFSNQLSENYARGERDLMFGQYPGLVWSGQVKLQKSNTDLLDSTIKCYYEKGTHVTNVVNSKGKQIEVAQYDTGSEDEDYLENHLNEGDDDLENHLNHNI